MRRHTLLIVLGLSALLVGAGLFYLVSTGQQADWADVERNPVPPERPASLTNGTVTEYAIEYEQQRLYNDVLAAHDHRLQWNESIVNVCRATAVTASDGSAFRVELQCAGGLDSRDDPGRDEAFEYRVSYRINGTATEQVAIGGFPYEERDVLRTREGTVSTPAR